MNFEIRDALIEKRNTLEQAEKNTMKKNEDKQGVLHQTNTTTEINFLASLSYLSNENDKMIIHVENRNFCQNKTKTLMEYSWIPYCFPTKVIQKVEEYYNGWLIVGSESESEREEKMERGRESEIGKEFVKTTF